MMQTILKPRGHFKAIWRDIVTGETGFVESDNMTVTHGVNALLAGFLKNNFTFSGRTETKKRYLHTLELGGQPAGTTFSPAMPADADNTIEQVKFTRALYNGTTTNTGVAIAPPTSCLLYTSPSPRD